MVQLRAHYELHYLKQANAPAEPGPSTSQLPETSGKVSFTSRYQRRERVSVDELAEYFKVGREDFDTCDPIEWWHAR